MKKQIAAAAAIILTLTMLAGCKSKTSRPFDYDLAKYITLGDYTGIEYKYSVEKVTPEAVTSYINTALSDKGYGEVTEITDRAVMNGDSVNIAFVGKMNGEEFEGGSSESYDLVIGSKSFIDGFEDGLIGVKKGETKVLNLKFPENYGKEELNGKDVEFTVTVNSIKKTVYPELTDEIVKEISDYDNVADYNTYANEQVKAQNEKTANDNKETEIWNKVVSNTKVTKYPDDEVARYKELILKSYDSQAQSSYGMTYEEFAKQMYGKTNEEIDADITEQAQNAVREYMTIVAIARDQDLDISDEEYKAQTDKYAASNGYKTTQEFINAIDEGQFYLSLLIDKVMDFIVENAVEVK